VTSASGQAFIGASGWNYKHWTHGVFYPESLKSAAWLEFYAQHFKTVEINNSFYRLPSEEAFRNWRDQTPKDFVFSVKASRFLTHIKRLKDPEDPLDSFFSRARRLGAKLGPILFQLPPRFKVDLIRLDRFLRVLKECSNRKIRSAIEVRDPTWLVSDVFELLARNRVALCLADWRDMPVTGPVTADFVYVRRHYGGAGEGDYGRADLNRDVRQIQEWLREKKDVYVYFNNDWKGFAIKNAQYVQRRLLN